VLPSPHCRTCPRTTGHEPTPTALPPPQNLARPAAAAELGVVRRFLAFSMKRAVTILLFLASLLSTRADELRIARFDAKRVFEQYQRTKDESAQRSKYDDPPTEADQAVERYNTQKKRVKELQASVAAAAADARERLQSQLDGVILAAQNTELLIRLLRLQSEQELREKALSVRAQILKEIWQAASYFATERHYQFVVRSDLAGDGLFVSVITTERADDLTDAILIRLNEQYAAKKSK
jgi:Skp family chaperone for outer membrane proteins